MHTKDTRSPESIGPWQRVQRSAPVPGIVLVIVVLIAARWLVTPLYLNLGYLELARRTPEGGRARDFFERAAAVSPQDPNVARALAMLALERGDWSEAYSQLQSASASQPEDALIHWQMGRALDGLGQSDAAEDEFRSAGAASFFLNAALRQRHQKDWPGAERNFLRAFEIAPRDPTLARAVGEFYLEWRKPDRAHDYFEQALKFERREFEQALLRGELAELRGDAMAAEREFHAAIGLDTNNPQGYRRLAESYVARGDVAGAIRTLKQGSAFATPAFDLNLRAAQLSIYVKDWPAAENALEHARTEQQNNDEVYLVRAQLELARDRPDAAQLALERALSITPYNAETHFWMGRTLAQLGQCDAARLAYAEALALAPDDLRFAPAQQQWGACK